MIKGLAFLCTVFVSVTQLNAKVSYSAIEEQVLDLVSSYREKFDEE